MLIINKNKHFLSSRNLTAHCFYLVILTFSIFSTSATGQIIYNTGDLDFQSTGQSIWASGTAFRKSESVFVGTQWSNKTATIGGIAGDANAVVIPAVDPLYTNIFVPRIFVPTPTWSNPFKGYYTGCGCTKRVKIFPGTNAVTADTRTGAQLDVHTSGKVGLEFGYSIDSGSIDTDATFSAGASLPDFVKTNEYIDLNTSTSFDNGSFSTQSPKIEAYISAILQLSGSVDATACGLTFGCATGSFNLPTVDTNQRIVSIDPNSLKILEGILPGGNSFAEVPILNQSLTLEGGATIAPPVVGFKLTGPLGITLATSLPPTPSLSVDLAEVTVQVPDIATNGTQSGDKLNSSGRDDLLSLQLDLDGAASLFGGLPPVGINFDLIDTPIFKVGASLDLIDVDAGPVLGVTQDFELIPTLMATLAFSNPVEIMGIAGLQSTWTGLWDKLPEFAIFDDTTVTPTFWLDAMLRNTLGLDLGLVGTLDLLKLGATGSIGGLDILGFGPISLNNLLGIDNTLFETPKVGFDVANFNFGLGGFNPVAGNSFTLLAIQAIPSPGTLLLVLFGGFFIRRSALRRAQ